MLYGEIVIDDVAAGSQGDDDDDQEAVNVEDTLHQGCPQLERVVCYFAGVEDFEENEEYLEEERGEEEDGETLARSALTDQLEELFPAVEGDEGSLGQQWDRPAVHLQV